MGRLGDKFPDDFKKSIIDRNLNPGQVLYLFCEFTNPQKDKFLVLVHPGTRPLLFIVNSAIHPYIQNRPHLLRCQMTLRASTYNFLDHDSYVNCSEVIDHFTEAEIRDQVMNDIGRIQGELDQSSKGAIVRAVQSAKTITQHHKQLIIQSLQ